MSIFNQIVSDPQQNRARQTVRRTAGGEVRPSAKSAGTTSQKPAPEQGELVRGEVVDIRRDRITVRLDNGAVVSARTEGSLPLVIGQKAGFYVAEAAENQILLRLAKEEGSLENPAAEKALLAAGIQKNARTLAIVEALLAHQQPVTGESIRHYLSLAVRYPELAEKDFVLMETNHLPVDAEHVAVFAAQNEGRNRLAEQTAALLEEVFSAIEGLPQEEAAQVLRELAALSGFRDAQTPPEGAEAAAGRAKEPPEVPETATGREQELRGEALSEEAGGKPPEGFGAATGREQELRGEALSEEAGGKPPEGFGAAAGNTKASPAEIETTAGRAKEPPEEIETTTGRAKEPPEEIGTTTGRAQEFRSMAEGSEARPEEAGGKAAAGDARGTPLFVLLQEEKEKIYNSFLLSPEDVGKQDGVRKYYERLQEQAAGLERLLGKLAAREGRGEQAQAAKQLRANLSFLDAVGQVFPFVQLPLRFREGTAHGELYVYERKRVLSPSDTISALLHLELEALGTTDIYVALSGKSVSAKFSMAGEEARRQIASELPELSRALGAKGYALDARVEVREPQEKDSPLEQFLEAHAPAGLSRYTFDMRA